MKTKRSFKVLSLALVLAMLMSLFTVNAFAARSYSEIVVTPNQTVPIEFPSDIIGGKMTGASSSNTSVAQYSSHSDTVAYFLVKEIGTANITIQYTNSSGIKDYFGFSLRVSNTTSGGNETAQSMTFSMLNSEQTSTNTYTSVTNLYSSNSNVASATFNQATGRIVVRALSNGSATITAKGVRSGAEYNVSIAVTVNTGSTATTGVVRSGNTITMPKGTTYNLDGTYYSAALAGNNYPNIATAAVSGPVGSQIVTFTALSQGMTTVAIQYKTSETAALQVDTFLVTVTDVATTVQTAPATSLVVGEMKRVGSLGTIDASSVRSQNTAIAEVTPSTSELLIRGIAAGTTTITFNAIPANGNTTYSYTMSVTVTGTGTTTTTTTGGGITFTKDTYTLSKSKAGKAYTFNGMVKLNGEAVKVNELLWVSTDTSVVSVNSKTGKFKVLKNSGSARLIAVSKDGKSVGSTLINAK